MPRQLRIEYPGAIYHVMNRGDRREPIFHDEYDRKHDGLRSPPSVLSLLSSDTTRSVICPSSGTVSICILKLWP
jgi:hypothetical protein